MDTFAQDVCALVSVDSSNSTALMNAAKQLAGAFTDLLNVAQPGSDEVCSAKTIERNIWFQFVNFSRFLRC